MSIERGGSFYSSCVGLPTVSRQSDSKSVLRSGRIHNLIPLFRKSGSFNHCFLNAAREEMFSLSKGCTTSRTLRSGLLYVIRAGGSFKKTGDDNNDVVSIAVSPSSSSSSLPCVRLAVPVACRYKQAQPDRTWPSNRRRTNHRHSSSRKASAFHSLFILLDEEWSEDNAETRSWAVKGNGRSSHARLPNLGTQ